MIRRKRCGEAARLPVSAAQQSFGKFHVMGGCIGGSFCFEAIVKTSEPGRLELAIEWRRVADGGRGDELELAYLELDEEAA